MRLLHTMHTLAAFAALAAAKDTGADTKAAPATDTIEAGAGTDTVAGADTTADASVTDLSASDSITGSDILLSPDGDGERPYTMEQADKELGELVLFAVKLREQGSTLTDVLAVLAKNTYGIDAR